MNYKKLYTGLLVALCFAMLPVAKSISAELVAPQIVIKNVSDQLKVRMDDEIFAGDFGRVTEYVDQVVFPIVDFNRISRIVLGPLWKKATAEQKVRFQKEFKILLVRTYSRAFVEFEEWTIRYLPLKKFSPEVKKVTVRTQVLQPGIKPIGVDYKMGFFSGQWKIYDIKIEGISLAINYRTSFKNEIRRSGSSGSLDSLIDKLAQKNQKKAAINTAKSSVE